MSSVSYHTGLDTSTCSIIRLMRTWKVGLGKGGWGNQKPLKALLLRRWLHYLDHWTRNWMTFTQIRFNSDFWRWAHPKTCHFPSFTACQASLRIPNLRWATWTRAENWNFHSTSMPPSSVPERFLPDKECKLCTNLGGLPQLWLKRQTKWNDRVVLSIKKKSSKKDAKLDYTVDRGTKENITRDKWTNYFKQVCFSALKFAV